MCLDFNVLHSRNQYLMQLGIDMINGISGPKIKFYKPCPDSCCIRCKL